MVRVSVISLSAVVGTALLVGAGAADGANSERTGPETPAAVSFATEILPIFEASCVNCHGGEYEGEQRIEAALDLRSYEALMAGSEFGTVIEAGDPDKSILLDMVAVGDMPEEGDPLTPEQIELIRTWIVEGAEDNQQ